MTNDQPVEVCHYDRDGKSDGESATDTTYWRHQLARGSGGCNVTVASAGHGDDGPVQGLWQGVEHGVGLVLLQSIPEPSKYQHAHADSHTQ